MSELSILLETLIPPPTELNDTHKEYSVAITIIILSLLTSLAVLARLGQRWSTRTIGLDDYAILFALIFYLAWTAIAVYFCLNSGYGKPLSEVTYNELITFCKGIFVAAWMYPVMSTSIRVSVLIYYRRIFAKGNAIYSTTIWVLLALQGIYFLVFEITCTFSCRPMRDAWEPIKRNTSCSMLYIVSTVALYAIGAVFDVLLLGFPIYAVAKLQMPLKKRLGVIFVFFLGACSCIAAAYKLGIFTGASRSWKPADPDWFSYQASIYTPTQFEVYGKIFWIPTQLEPAVALIGTSLPSIFALYSTASSKLSQVRRESMFFRNEPDIEKPGGELAVGEVKLSGGSGGSGGKSGVKDLSSQESV
ncbi:hypothetical protein HYFRA_00007988 [Hymenoscyphus fraxineus]|uniref:Rhodopsin domain-containing protein n=1 Tax=Hymenoscyphus fraxineus TaxID=746836 RepID=A0A9N9KSC0_9HELO|nr:hypothetical protein HYFRA_00007988 [Hymenoscyphus fraxineus]